MEKLKRELLMLMLSFAGIIGWEGALAQDTVTVIGTVTSAEDNLPLIGKHGENDPLRTAETDLSKTD